MAGSASAVAVLGCLTILAAVFRLLRWRLDIVVPALLLVMLVVMGAIGWVTANSNALLQLMGRDNTLTGRTDLWTLALEEIAHRPWLGYGYSAFWIYKLDYVASLFDWGVPHAHNGFLELALNIGVIGVAIFTIGFIRSFARALRGLRIDTSAAGLWPILFLSFVLLYNLTESTVLGHNSLYWALYVSSGLTAAIRAVPQPAASGRQAVSVRWERGMRGRARRMVAQSPSPRQES
jgi:O-antigen ligase